MGYTNFMLPVVVFLLLFFIPSFFIFKRIYTKRGQDSMLANTVMSIFSMFVFPVIIIFITHIALTVIVMPIVNSREFNRKDWYEDSGYRLNMFLEIKKELIGKKRNEVISILGTNFEKGPEYICVNSINYCVNDPDDIGISLDHSAMVFCFDENDRVVRVTVQSV
jgi:hypothetical protein